MIPSLHTKEERIEWLIRRAEDLLAEDADDAYSSETCVGALREAVELIRKDFPNPDSTV